MNEAGQILLSVKSENPGFAIFMQAWSLSKSCMILLRFFLKLCRLNAF